MEFDSQLLQDLFQFLRTLESVRLPDKFESLRGRLLSRIQTTLAGVDNYMDMQLGKLPKDHSAADDSSEEYVIPDQRSLSPRSFLYQHQSSMKTYHVEAKQRRNQSPIPHRPPAYLPLESSDLSSPPPAAPSVIRLPPITPSEDTEVSEGIQTEDSEVTMYNHMNLLLAESKSHFFGQLHRREKWFLFENLRPFWAALVGSHLLSYDNRTDEKPSQILSIKGCTCKPVAVPQRNAKKLSNSTFELCYQDDKSYQFIALTPKEMKQWVTMIVRWEAKSHETNDVPKPVAHIPEAISSLDNSNTIDEYAAIDDEMVIVNIAEALAKPASVPKKPNPPTYPVRQPAKPETKPKHNPQKTVNHLSPVYPKLMNSPLPPPPSSMQSSEHDGEDVYQMIEDSNHVQPYPGNHSNRQIGQKQLSGSVEDIQYKGDEIYDDLCIVKTDVQGKIGTENVRRETEKNLPAEDDVATYDDVVVVKKEVEQIRKNENIAKESSEVEKQKKSPKELPPTHTKPSPKKGLFGIFKNKNQSPQKEGVKKKLINSFPQKESRTITPPKLSIDQRSSETCMNNEALSDLTDYSSVPPPRPVQGDKSSPNDIGDDKENGIYDDISNKKDGYNNHLITPEMKLEKGRQDSGRSPRNETHKKVVRDLSETFDDEIYQNQPGDGNLEDSIEHYQVPRTDANAQSPSSKEDYDDPDPIYDDVAIVTQKRRENEQAKHKPAVASPKKTTCGPAVMVKPSGNSVANKFNKISLPVPEKTSFENIQHRFGPARKPKAQPVILPFKKH